MHSRISMNIIILGVRISDFQLYPGIYQVQEIHSLFYGHGGSELWVANWWVEATFTCQQESVVFLGEYQLLKYMHVFIYDNTLCKSLLDCIIKLRTNFNCAKLKFELVNCPAWRHVNVFCWLLKSNRVNCCGSVALFTHCWAVQLSAMSSQSKNASKNKEL